jgi:hypothetical protein
MKRFVALCCALLLLSLNAQSQTNGTCPDTLQTTFINYSEYSFFIAGIDNDQSVSWDFGDGFAAVDDSLISHAFMAGTYLITAIFFDADCPWDGPSLLSTELVVEACGIEISYVETKTGLFTFTAVGIPEEYPMYWDMGDGTQIVETWVVDNFYEPGTYEICAWYYTEFCPDTVEACVEMVYAPDTTCSAEFSYELIESEFVEGYYQTTALHAWNNSPEFTYIWDYGDGPTVGSADIMMNSESFWEAEEHGTQVCLTTIFGACSDTVCHRVMNCEFGNVTIETTAFGIPEGEVATINLNVSFYLVPGLNDNFTLNNEDSIHFTNVCSTESCGDVHLNIPAQCDSMRVRVFYLQNTTPILDTVFYSPSSSVVTFVFEQPGCTWFSLVDEVAALFNVWPIYTEDNFNVFGPAEMNYTMFDLSGKICAEGKLFSGGQISMAERAPGMYLLFLRSGNQSYTARIVRQP